MLAASFRKSMSRSASRVISQRTAAISQHMSSSSTLNATEVLCIVVQPRPQTRAYSLNLQPTVKFESVSSLRTYILNRPEKLNALDDQMLSILRPKIEVLNIRPLVLHHTRKKKF